MVNGRFLTNCKINQLLKHDYGTKFGAVITPPLPLPGGFGLPYYGVKGACAVTQVSAKAGPELRAASYSSILLDRGELEDELAGGARALALALACVVVVEKKLRSATNSLLTNHYLAGFTDSDGYFGISTPSPIRLIPEIPCSSKVLTEHGSADIILPLPSNPRPSPLRMAHKLGEREGGVRFIFVLGQKDPTILQRVKYEFGGYLYHYKPTDNYLLELSSLSQNLQIIEYFDHYNLNSIKHLAFFKWRKAYRIVQRKEHLTEKGLSKIKLLGKSISELIK